MYMNLSEFRKDLSNQFNKALNETVHIERAGVVYALRAMNYTLKDGKLSVPDLQLDATKGTAVTTAVPTSVGEIVQKSITEGETMLRKAQEAIRSKTKEPFLCKIHGTLLDARGRCLTKGCKYG